MLQYIGHCNSINDSPFAFCCDCLNNFDLLFPLFCCDCLNAKFVTTMIHIERIMGTLGRIIGKNSENCRIEEKSIFGSGLDPGDV